MLIRVDQTTVDLFVDTICDLMVLEPRRITIANLTEFIDTETKVQINIINKDKWLINIPGSHSYVLDKDHKEQITNAVSKRENALLLEIHQEMYSSKKNLYELFTEIQKMREEKPMVDEAWKNLLTVYALNMDGDENVS